MTRFLYQAPLPHFLDDVHAGRMSTLLSERFAAVQDQAPGESEVEAWRRSLGALAGVLERPELSTSEIFVELFMPLNSRRCDALLTGRTVGGPSAVVIELKQWSLVRPSHLQDHVLGGGHLAVHPSVQVGDYVETLRYYHSAFTGEGEAIALSGAVLLHDLSMHNGGALLRDGHRFGDAPQRYPLFLAHEQAALGFWLAERLVPGPGTEVARRIRSGHALPSPKLLDLVVQTIKNEQQWRLLDEQKTAFFSIRDAVMGARSQGNQRVFIIRGGPGTGKSVIALQLLADAARAEWKVVHAAGSKAFQTVLQGITIEFSDGLMKKIHGVKTKKALPVRDLFTTFAEVAQLARERPRGLDLVICDEAHRLWEYRRKKYPNGKIEWLSDRPMVQEVITSSLVSAFFLDDDQSVRPGEIGRSDLIVEHAERLGVPWTRIDLDKQFRCAGSTSYIRWVEGLLGRRPGLDLDWREHDAYTCRLWDSMPALDAHLRGLPANRRRRLVAGYCWRWNKPDALHRLPYDLHDPRFGTWRGAWIEKTGKDLKPLDHQYFRWSRLDESYEQVGSIYSVQGFEFDDIGLIWGEDLVWRGDRWVAQLDKNKDGAFKKEIRSSGADPVDKLLNVYRVLLTRGMLSTHLFILDPETREHVRRALAAEALPLAMAANAGGQETNTAPSRIPPRPSLVSLPPTTSRRFRPRLVTPDRKNPWTTGVPLIDLAAAAGDFGPERLLATTAIDSEEWYAWEGAPPFAPGDFLARITGSSMEPLIPNGAWCLFRLLADGVPRGQPVLVRLVESGVEGARYTVKDVSVEWTAAESGERVARQIVLRPRNPAYPVMHYAGTETAQVSIVAELVEVVGHPAQE